MWINTALFAAGVFLCQQLQSLPNLYWSVALLLLVLFAIPLVWGRTDRRILPFLLLCLGFGWAVVYGNWKLNDRLAPGLIKQPVVLTGGIVELPRQNDQRYHGQQHRDWRFIFEPQSALFNGEPVKVPSRISLSWYETDQWLRSGQQWQLQVKLKPPAGLQNPGVFDYEGWLFQKGVGARGYVVKSEHNRQLVEGNGLPGFDELREHIRWSLADYPEFPAASALVLALTVGDKSRISAQSWETFRKLGINHLVAISGLHVGMIVMVIYWLAGRLWRLSVHGCEWVPAPRIQALSGLVAAFFYAGMAGFSLPTQRALIMISVVLLAKLFLVNLQPFRQLAIAVFIVLLWDPPAIIMPGFWLSFMAVTAIFVSIGNKDSTGLRSKFRQLLVMQWSITLLLLPFSLLFFKQTSIVSPVANLLLIPLFSFFVVPAALLMTFLKQSGFGMIETLFIHFLQSIELLLTFLDSISGYEWFVFQTAEISVYRFVILLSAVFVWHFGRIPYQKPGAILMVVAALWFPSAKKPEDQLFVTVLDVGQGTSILLQTAAKTLLYDLGPRYGNGNSATLSVVVPFLRNKGISRVDRLIITHSDSDHAGDLQGFLQAVDVDKIVAGEALDISRQHDLCQSGQRWQWHQTGFEFLSPDGNPVKNNNASCVLRVENGENTLLLTGDAEQTVERRLLKTDRQKLAADVVLVPHHGSKSSSTPEFVKAVDARYAVNTSGYLNRYGFPKEVIKERWMKNGAQFLNTGDSGALEMMLGQQEGDISFETFRQGYAKYWHWGR